LKRSFRESKNVRERERERERNRLI
jgi:hypothetical protein